MNETSKRDYPQVFLVLYEIGYEEGVVMGVFFDRGRALNLRDKLERGDPFKLGHYRVEAWREGDTEGEEIKPD